MYKNLQDCYARGPTPQSIPHARPQPPPRSGALLRAFLLLATMVLSMSPAAAAETVQLYAAGSLKAALTELARQYEAANGVKVETSFAPSGLLRQRIEKGETPQVFASANMAHPQKLAAQKMGGPVVLFARNRLCALAQAGVPLSPATLLTALLDPKIRVGTSTPKADPAGDYAWKSFARAEALQAGAEKKLQAKALQLTGGPTSETPPAGRNPYGWVMEQKKADVFLTYCTNAVLARKEVATLQIVDLPANLSVGADYGLIVIDQKNVAAWRLAAYILSPEGQGILAKYGFEAPGLPMK